MQALMHLKPYNVHLKYRLKTFFYIFFNPNRIKALNPHSAHTVHCGGDVVWCTTLDR